MTFEHRHFSNECIVVEIGLPHFEYQYQKKERVFVGVCEFCSRKNELPEVCPCKRVRYCN